MKIVYVASFSTLDDVTPELAAFRHKVAAIKCVADKLLALIDADTRAKRLLRLKIVAALAQTGLFYHDGLEIALDVYELTVQ